MVDRQFSGDYGNLGAAPNMNSHKRPWEDFTSDWAYHDTQWNTFETTNDTMGDIGVLQHSNVAMIDDTVSYEQQVCYGSVCDHRLIRDVSRR